MEVLVGHIISELENKIDNKGQINLEEALFLYENADFEGLLSAAGRIRQANSGKKVDLCSIMNARSGQCSENCKYCAQSAHYQTGIDEYAMADSAAILQMAKENEEYGVHRFSIVTSGPSVEGIEFDKLLGTIRNLRKQSKIGICASIGSVSYEQALMLKDAGLQMLHHNLETSRSYFPVICDTHFYDQRLETIQNAKRAGLDICCGGIIGMGESVTDRLEMAIEARFLGVKSFPVNILDPVPGTPFESLPKIDPLEVIRTLAVYRFILPRTTIRYAGGRISLGDAQKLGLQGGVDGLMVGDYLTTVGNKIPEDLSMLQNLGFEVV